MNDFDNAPQWYWAAGVGEDGLAGERFVVACGQRELWSRVRREVDPQERPAWMGFGPPSGEATLADCLQVFLAAREMYGAAYNRTTLELAQVSAWAEFLLTARGDLCNYVSNPITHAFLPRDPYSEEITSRLRDRIRATTGRDRQ